jgi:hypothetical protein
VIAVFADDAERVAASEFFELFKTPWQFYRDGGHYDALICTNGRFPCASAKLVFMYGACRTSFDEQNGIQIRSRERGRILSYKKDRIPIYGESLTFDNRQYHSLADERSGELAALELASGGQTVIRIGYDLFAEIRHLLTVGQPASRSQIPTLELHISLLRDLLLTHSVPLVEIATTPAGYNFTVCLTHDVDHAGIRYHKCDHAMLGFLYRAIIGSLVNVCTGRGSLEALSANWLAVLSLPFVYMGLAEDFWDQFERYLEIEKDLASTFFVVPKKNDPGQSDHGPAPRRRAVRYDIADLSSCLRALISKRCEIALHGIDAWRDDVKGRAESDSIGKATGSSNTGVRMHWLYFDQQSPRLLEKAGFSYDSTVGYNEAVGYRAGTTQAFKALDVERILELPMHIMDTALFFPSRMGLSSDEATTVVDALVNNASRFGGVLTLNWHDRSIGPERLWGAFYIGLVEKLKQAQPWFATAADSVSWFRKRRSASIEDLAKEEGSSKRIKVFLKPSNDNTPGLRLRIHKPSASSNSGVEQTTYHTNFTDVEFNDSAEFEI